MSDTLIDAISHRDIAVHRNRTPVMVTTVCKRKRRSRECDCSSERGRHKIVFHARILFDPLIADHRTTSVVHSSVICAPLDDGALASAC